MQVQSKVFFIPLHEIVVPPYRQRKFFDQASALELQLSIERDGLLNPIALRHDRHTLLAGERRLRVIDIIHKLGKTFMFNGEVVPPFTIPCTILSIREEDEYFQAEWAENTNRDNLTWQEQADVRARLHNTREAQKGKGNQTISDTAKEVFGKEEVKGHYVTDISRDLLIHKHLNDPDVAGAKTRKDAIKIIELKNRKKYEQEYANTHELNSQDSPHTLIIGDSMQELSLLPDSSFDCILTDPIYGIGADTFGDQTLINHEYEDSYQTWQRLMEVFAREFFRLARGQAHAYIFCDIRRWNELKDYYTRAGWSVWHKPIIWYKGNRGTLPSPGFGPRYTYEAILFANKGKKPVRKIAHDVISIATGTKPRFAAEKPVELYRELLSRTVEPGNTVLDASCGSGTIFPAAGSLLCRATGIEINKETANLARIRLSEEYKPGINSLEEVLNNGNA